METRRILLGILERQKVTLPSYTSQMHHEGDGCQRSVFVATNLLPSWTNDWFRYRRHFFLPASHPFQLFQTQQCKSHRNWNSRTHCHHQCHDNTCLSFAARTPNVPNHALCHDTATTRILDGDLVLGMGTILYSETGEVTKRTVDMVSTLT
jgi:hypothetical protein